VNDTHLAACHVRDDGCSQDVRVVHIIADAPVVLIVVDDEPCGQLAAQDGSPDDCAEVPGEDAEVVAGA